MPLKLHIQKPLEHLRTLVSVAPAFRTLVGANDALEANNSATALAAIHYGATEDKDHGDKPKQKKKPFPRATVGLVQYSSNNQSGRWVTQIQMSVLLEAHTLATDADESLGGRYSAWLGRIESLVDTIKDPPDNAVRLNVTSVELSRAPGRLDPDSDPGDGEVWGVEFVVGCTT